MGYQYSMQTIKYCLLFAAMLPYLGFAQTLGHLTIVGKNQWLFYGVEFSNESSKEKSAESAALIAGVNAQLKDNGVSMLVSLTPIKARIFKQHLPDDKLLTPYLESNYTRLLGLLTAKGVAAADISSAFTAHTAQPDATLYYRLDSHWSHLGAFLAAETIKKEIDTRPDIAAAIAELPILTMTMIEQKKSRPSKARDLTQLLKAEDAEKYETEQIFPIFFRRGTSAAKPTGAEGVPKVALIGSGYSQEWTGFPGALRHLLQRDVGNYSLDASTGQWVNLYRYLQSDTFQLAPPKLIVWEMPERDMVSPPNFKYRDAKYQMQSTDWVMGASAWAQRSCQPGSGTVKSLSSSAKDSKASGLGGIKVSNAGANTSVDINFAKLNKGTDYFDAQVSAAANQVLSIEVTAGKKIKLPDLTVAADGKSHVIRIPLTSSEGPVSKAKITLSAASSNFELTGLQVCQHKPIAP
jgi:alginate O-acetyltransferase complex protein AlgJ